MAGMSVERAVYVARTNLTQWRMFAEQSGDVYSLKAVDEVLEAVGVLAAAAGVAPAATVHNRKDVSRERGGVTAVVETSKKAPRGVAAAPPPAPDLTDKERVALTDLWVASHANGHDFGITSEMPRVPAKSRGALISSLQKKGLIEVHDEVAPTVVQFTFTGQGRSLFHDFEGSPGLASDVSESDAPAAESGSSTMPKKSGGGAVVQEPETPAKGKGKKGAAAPVKVEPATAPAADTPRRGRPPKSEATNGSGLSAKEILILQYLNDNGRTSRGVLAEKCAASSKLLGAATREGGGRQGGGLEGRGYLVGQRIEGERQLQYVITSAGKQALKQALKS